MDLLKTITPNPPADFSPIINTGRINSFRAWCQSVIPLVYDNSLSYYELLCKLIDYLNKVISNLNEVNQDIEKLHIAYNLLQDYVNNYFANLDVQEEINKKLDEMAASGELSQLLFKYYGVCVNTYGADPKGIEDSTEAFNTAFQKAKELNTFVFLKGNYLLSSVIDVSCSLQGFNSTLTIKSLNEERTVDDPRLYSIFYIQGNNIHFNDLIINDISTGEPDKKYNYFTCFMFNHCNNFTLSNVQFKTLTSLYKCPIDVYGDCNNGLITNCNFIMNGDQKSGGIWCRAVTGNTSNIVFDNVNVEKTGGDEFIAIWPEVNNISNCSIKNSVFTNHIGTYNLGNAILLGGGISTNPEQSSENLSIVNCKINMAYIPVSVINCYKNNVLYNKNPIIKDCTINLKSVAGTNVGFTPVAVIRGDATINQTLKVLNSTINISGVTDLVFISNALLISDCNFTSNTTNNTSRISSMNNSGTVVKNCVSYGVKLGYASLFENCYLKRTDNVSNGFSFDGNTKNCVFEKSEFVAGINDATENTRNYILDNNLFINIYLHTSENNTSTVLTHNTFINGYYSVNFKHDSATNGFNYVQRPS